MCISSISALDTPLAGLRTRADAPEIPGSDRDASQLPGLRQTAVWRSFQTNVLFRLTTDEADDTSAGGLSRNNRGTDAAAVAMPCHLGPCTTARA